MRDFGKISLALRMIKGALNADCDEEVQQLGYYNVILYD